MEREDAYYALRTIQTDRTTGCTYQILNPKRSEMANMISDAFNAYTWKAYGYAMIPIFFYITELDKEYY